VERFAGPARSSASRRQRFECLEELRDVLARHRKLRRFAIHLAHRHFVLGPGEILIERPDPDRRTQHVTVGRLDEEPEARPTTWLFEEGPALRLSEAVYCICVSDPNKTEACIRHGKSRTPAAAHQKEEAVTRREFRWADMSAGGADKVTPGSN
jgi:hypothetical protein